jgi:hypothetical protein
MFKSTKYYRFDLHLIEYRYLIEIASDPFMKQFGPFLLTDLIDQAWEEKVIR